MFKEKLKCGFEAINFDPCYRPNGCDECISDHYCEVCNDYHDCDCGCVCHEEKEMSDL